MEDESLEWPDLTSYPQSYKASPQKTLRDEYAMAALTGLCAARVESSINKLAAALLVTDSVLIADEALRQRKKWHNDK